MEHPRVSKAMVTDPYRATVFTSERGSKSER